MKHHTSPNIGDWYKNQENYSTFEVVALDEKGQYVEIQHFGGEIEELDLETWYELELISIPAPEDSSGPYEIPKEDISYSDHEMYRDLSDFISYLDNN